MPTVADTHGRAAVLVPPSNIPRDTEGRLPVGEQRLADYVGPSVPRWRELFAKIKAAWSAGEAVEITYCDPD